MRRSDSERPLSFVTIIIIIIIESSLRFTVIYICAMFEMVIVIPCGKLYFFSRKVRGFLYLVEPPSRFGCLGGSPLVLFEDCIACIACMNLYALTSAPFLLVGVYVTGR